MHDHKKSFKLAWSSWWHRCLLNKLLLPLLLLDLYLGGHPAEEGKDEKFLGVKIDSHLSWHNHTDYFIQKLNSRICLLKRANGYLNLYSRKLLSNSLLNPLLNITFCSVWGNTPNDQLNYDTVQGTVLSTLHGRLIFGYASLFDRTVQDTQADIDWYRLCMIIEIDNGACLCHSILMIT